MESTGENLKKSEQTEIKIGDKCKTTDWIQVGDKKIKYGTKVEIIAKSAGKGSFAKCEVDGKTVTFAVRDDEVELWDEREGESVSRNNGEEKQQTAN